MRLVHLALLVPLASPAWAQSVGVTVTEAWSRATSRTAQTGAIYLTVTAAEPDRLLSASSPSATTAELHQSRMTNNVMEMRAVPGGLPVQPGTPIRMAPGGYHLMLMGLKQPLTQGESIPVTLVFEHAGVVTVDAIIAGAGASAPPPGK